ncbi:MFS transporter [Mesorhizobium sp.]|uniref:MFS transporter n=1 Tax=Mesorhizobium sp. TaxID=1871066 RepID=UPI000FE6CD59|nr:MFS transporter [Mesorhizobium sp.]RWO53399.1 MAG: MFS transporter [Mesorhizobium sp.]TIN24642.1 MAG: MFS transporter [Mesorhizobium sp.]TIN42462.1 MAG: MFS transporter [Mesorhizobium sp.]TJU79401.1 MAG: MFS transporter [Mesorhizobium sp.]TJU91233.1 MAG: MFS transporter [Mesorhizobium sp.]
MDTLNGMQAAIRGRWAVAAIFLANGFLTGAWAPQIPVVLTRLDISKFTLGLLILLFGAGAVTAMTWCGHLISRHGSRTVLSWFGLIGSFGLLVVALAPNVPLAAIAMFIFGGSIGGMDVAMNANAVTVERRLSRAIMSSSHGFWSLGGFAGGALGGLAIQNYGHLAHATVVTALAFAVIAVAVRYLIAEDKPVQASSGVIGHRKFALPGNPLVYLVGLMALMTMISEGAVLDWAALYLQQELGTDLAVAGLAYAAFSGVMAVMRFVGDGVRNRFGAVTTLRVSALVAAAGMLVAGLAPSPWLAISAFAFCGFGIANMVPILFSAGGNQEGMSSGTGMSVVTTMGYSGILVAPSAIGFIAEHSSFGPIFVALSGLLVVVFLMAGLAHRAEFAPDAAPAE